MSDGALAAPFVAIARWVAPLVAAAALLAPASANAAVEPVLAGSVSNATTLAGVDAVAVAGSYAYATGYYAGRLSAIDISNPFSPFIAGSSESTSGLTNGDTVNIAGGYAFVVSKNRNGPKGSGEDDDGTGNSLTILDIHTNPAEPTVIGSVHDSGSLFGAYGVAVSGNYAYVASQGCLNEAEQPCPNPTAGNDLDVIEIEGAGAPRIVATLSSTKEPQAFSHVTAVAISGNYAYLTASYQDRLTVVDIANPLSPTLVTSLRDATNLPFPVDVAISGNYAYVINQKSTGPLAVVDIGNPEKPKVVGSLSGTALAGGYRIRVRGKIAYVAASQDAGIGIVDVSDPLSPRLLANYTNATHLHSTTGLDLDSTGSHVIATSTYLPGQHKTIFPPYALEPGGPELEGTVSVITLDPEPVEATIAAESEPANPTAQTSASFTFSVNDAVATVQCELDEGPWTQCTSPTSQSYTALGEGPHSFQVQATDSAGNTSTATYSWTITAPPKNTTPPSIAGTAAEGELLTASAGGWGGYPAPSFGYQWERCDASGGGCVAIEGVSEATYSVGAADVGSTLVVVVTATNGSGSVSAESAPTAVVTGPPVNTALPSIAGSAARGQVISASTGGWGGYPAPSFGYQWERCGVSGGGCVAIEGASEATYSVGAADVGSTLVVVVTGTNGSGSVSAESAPTAVVTGPPVNTSQPGVSGTAAQGQLLTASAGAWDGYPAPSFAYQWERCNSLGLACAAISGATASTYTAHSADADSTLVVVVEATNGSGSVSTESPPTAVVTAPPANTSLPVVSGTAAQGQVLTASAGGWSGYPAPSFGYRWERCGASGGGCAPIEGASEPTYPVGTADVGSTLVVVVKASNVDGSSAAESALTAAVAGAPSGGGSGGGGGGIVGGELSPGTAQIRAALLGAVLPGGKEARIASVRKHHGYLATFDAPGRGVVVVSWYEIPRGAHLASVKLVLVASGRVTVTVKGEVKLTLKLTARGRSLLAHDRQLKLTGQGVFTPAGGSPVSVTKAFTLRQGSRSS
jgi:hypothetical protein